MDSSLTVSVIGLGFVGSAMFETFAQKGMVAGHNLFGYDKYKSAPEFSSFEDCLSTNIMFLALPTQYKHATKEYDKSAIFQTCKRLTEVRYDGIIVIKSTVQPETTQKLSNEFPDLSFIHNPQFLKAVSAKEDFKNQVQVVLGKAPTCSQQKVKIIESFYVKYFPNAKISICSSLQSETMKIFCNTFYAAKVQIFTQFYLLCKKTGCEFDRVKDMMIGNGNINPDHTSVPGPDGNISYGGYCFPKDTNALNEYMQRTKSPHEVIDAVIKQRNTMRSDHVNQS